MTNYETKPFLYSNFESDLEAGWKPTYRSGEWAYQAPRDITIIHLGPEAEPKSRIVSIDHKHGGEVRNHDDHGRFFPKDGDSVLDIILYRDARPKPREVSGTAYVSEFGEVCSVTPDFIDGHATNCKGVRCTITLLD